MYGEVLIYDLKTDAVLEKLGHITYDNEAIAFQQLEAEYGDILAEWAERDYWPELVINDEE